MKSSKHARLDTLVFVEQNNSPLRAAEPQVKGMWKNAMKAPWVVPAFCVHLVTVQKIQHREGERAHSKDEGTADKTCWVMFRHHDQACDLHRMMSRFSSSYAFLFGRTSEGIVCIWKVCGTLGIIMENVLGSYSWLRKCLIVSALKFKYPFVQHRVNDVTNTFRCVCPVFRYSNKSGSWQRVVYLIRNSNVNAVILVVNQLQVSISHNPLQIGTSDQLFADTHHAHICLVFGHIGATASCQECNSSDGFSSISCEARMIWNSTFAGCILGRNFLSQSGPGIGAPANEAVWCLSARAWDLRCLEASSICQVSIRLIYTAPVFL